MNIYGANVISGATPVTAAHQTKHTDSAAKANESTRSNASVKDELELTGKAQLTSQAANATATHDSAPIRFDRVNEARAKIAAGVYDSPEYLEIALSRMIERNFG